MLRKGDGNWHVFSGNEIGTLLGAWTIEQSKGSTGRRAALASIVSSRMLKTMCEANNVRLKLRLVPRYRRFLIV